ncbi:MAG: Flp pilus assembly protein CpaB, partial [Desulfotignum sp.]|nr:Flp pilus assembly protein CpaB [Desulfotignum sp.]
SCVMRAFVPILLSILIALGGSYFLYNWLNKQRASEKTVSVKETRAVQVVVANVDLTWGTRINPETLSTKPYFEESLPPGYHSKIEDLTGRILVANLVAGEPVLESKLAPTTLQQGGIPAVLKPGTRAISVQGNKVLGVAGFIRPGNRVDVLLTLNHPDTGEEFTKTILENMLVLASGTQIVESSDAKTSPVDVYTLEVTPDQGERLTLASNQGRLKFALRGAVDDEVVLTRGVTVPEILAASSLAQIQGRQISSGVAQAPKPAATKTTRYAAPKKEKKTTIEVIKGLSLSKTEVPL